MPRCYSNTERIVGLRLGTMLAVSMLGIALLCACPLTAQVQTAPIGEPRGQEERPAHPIVKGAKAIREQHEKCSARFALNADALFQPHRWTLNHDAAETLDVLGPMIAKSGKHPARIEAYTAAAESESENQDVARRRALTVRTWLVDNSFLPKDTPMEGFSNSGPRHTQPPPSSAKGGGAAPPGENTNGAVDVVIDLCSE